MRHIYKEFLPSSLLCFPCPRSVGKPGASYFFLGYFFSRTLACLVSNCSWKNSQFIGIKITVLPFPPSCWNIRKSILTRVDLNICKVVIQII